MRLRLERTWPAGRLTLGCLYLPEGTWHNYTAEDRVRVLADRKTPGKKVWGETAVPAGTYKIVATYSPKFGRVMPEILVPGYAGLRFHGFRGERGDEKNTEGCIVCGYEKGVDGVYDARAGRAVNAKIMAALTSGDEVTIDIVNVAPEALEPVAA